MIWAELLYHDDGRQLHSLHQHSAACSLLSCPGGSGGGGAVAVAAHSMRPTSCRSVAQWLIKSFTPSL